jgi:hypothetical protein
MASAANSDRSPYTDRAQYTGPGANLFGKALFAHTSAVYVNLDGKSIRQPAAIQMLLADLETSMRTIKARGAFTNDTERDALLTLYREAAVKLRSRLPQTP